MPYLELYSASAKPNAARKLAIHFQAIDQSEEQTSACIAAQRGTGTVLLQQFAHRLLALAQAFDSQPVLYALLFLKRQIALVFSRLGVAGTGSCRGCCHLVLLNHWLLASADLS